MPRIILILLLLPSPVLGAADRYHLEFDNDLGAVTAQACFEGTPPRNLHRSSRAGQFTEWIRVGDRKVQPGSNESRISLRSLQADDCVSWRVNLTNATEAGDYRLALRLEDAILTAGNLWFWRDDDLRPIRVDVDLPEQAALSVPWKERVDSSGKTYYLPGRTGPRNWRSGTSKSGEFRLEEQA